jgi:hypothetical protein
MLKWHFKKLSCESIGRRWVHAFTVFYSKGIIANHEEYAIIQLFNANIYVELIYKDDIIIIDAP